MVGTVEVPWKRCTAKYGTEIETNLPLVGERGGFTSTKIVRIGVLLAWNVVYILKVRQVAMAHVDEIDITHNNELDVSMFERDTTEYQAGGDDYGSHSDTLNEFDDELLRLPFSEEEPVLDAELLSNMDAL